VRAVHVGHLGGQAFREVRFFHVLCCQALTALLVFKSALFEDGLAGGRDAWLTEIELDLELPFARTDIELALTAGRHEEESRRQHDDGNAWHPGEQARHGGSFVALQGGGRGCDITGTFPMLDPLLDPYVGAESEADAERHLEALFDERITPLVRTIVARKLRTFGPRKVVAAEDLEDVAGDAALVLLRRLRALRADPASEKIANLDDYVAAVAYSACAHYLRRRYPERSRLRNRVRYILGRDRRFARWETPEGLICGRASWHGREADRSAHDAIDALERDPSRWPSSWTRPLALERSDPAPLIAEIFLRVGGPVEFDRVVSLLATIWRVDSVQPPDTDALGQLPDANPGAEISLDQRRFAERLWAEVLQLPVRQRAALLLNLRSSQGAGLLWLLPVIGVATVREIATALELPGDEMAALWGRLPLDDNAIAERLSCSRQQVINLRMAARKRLSNRLPLLRTSSGVKTAGSGNLPGGSTSMRRET
jgi:hypothetical protein